MTRYTPLTLATLTLVFLSGCARPPEVQLADGSGASWSQWQDKWLVVNYWAEWCAPCRKEIPELNELHTSEDVVVLGVNFDGLTGKPLTDLMQEMSIQFPVLVSDPGPRWDRSPPTVLPSTLIIDPEGNLKDVLVGPQTYESLSRAVQLTAEI